MKPFYLLLALLPVALAVPAPQDGPVRDTQCTCPPPECPQEEPAGCDCRNKAILDCSDQKQAAGLTCPVPALAACPKQPNTENPAPPPPRKEKPPPAVKPNPNFKCPCEEIYCIQSYPESCECANRNARECYDNCGGPEPVYDDRCGFGDDTPPPRRDPNPQPQPDPFNTPGPVIPPDPLPPVENNPPPPPPPDCDTITDHDERKQCKEDAKQRKEEEKAKRKQEKEERKRRKEEEKNACGQGPPCKQGEECVDIIFEKVGGGSETRKGCLPEKESEG
ncbi:uncharacterized protein J3D65DRAFT_660183 [Phyllosticta citribraziliensis]|uniref:Uncharacterized protein n=1 Tax=Phyllosticta citribraziliensis TaxID=989973 RepID=A0ABR1LET4_9PEZI